MAASSERSRLESLGCCRQVAEELEWGPPQFGSGLLPDGAGAGVMALATISATRPHRAVVGSMHIMVASEALWNVGPLVVWLEVDGDGVERLQVEDIFGLSSPQDVDEEHRQVGLVPAIHLVDLVNKVPFRCQTLSYGVEVVGQGKSLDNSFNVPVPRVVMAKVTCSLSRQDLVFLFHRPRIKDGTGDRTCT